MKKGSVFGGILLIAGSTLGVGMLGLPILTGLAGFLPTLLMSFLAFAFMTSTALFLIEVGSWFDQGSNLSTQIEKTLGPFWKSISWTLYLFLFYSLLVAYISLSGIHLSSVFHTFFNYEIPTWLGSVGFVLLFGWIVYLGTYVVDHVNRYLMAGKILAFLLLVGLGVKYVQPSNLSFYLPKYAFFSLPILVIAFGFHNMIPALNHYFDGDKKRVQKAIIGGASLTFFVYSIWQAVAIGILPHDGPLGILSSFKMGIDAAQAIKNYVNNPLVDLFSQTLALFAILTSFLAQTLSLTHFLSDGFKKRGTNKLYFSLLALVPPLLCAISYPNIFYSALNFAGGICAVVLFGLIPALMIYYGKEKRSDLPKRLKISVYAVIAFAIFILSNQISELLGVNFFRHP